MDPATKAYLDSQHNELMEQFAESKREQARLHERCISLTAEVVELRQLLAASRAELATVKTSVVEVKKATDAKIAAQDVRIDAQDLRLDDLEQYGHRKTIRVQNVRMVPGEDKNSALILEAINERLAPSGITLREKDTIRYHRSSAPKDDCDIQGGKVAQCIIKLKNWRLRAQFQGLNVKKCGRKRTREGRAVESSMTSPSDG
jgi:hypothetical protein